MATIKLYINTDRGDISRAFVKSTSEPTTESNVPALVAGNKRNVEIYLIDSAGNYDARSGASNYALSIGAGPLAGTPSSGTFTLTDGTATTTALAHNASAQVVEDALNALNSSAGPFSQLVDVTSAYDGNYLVKFRTTGAVAALSGDASELSPQSAIVVDEARAGDGSTKEQQFIRLLRQPAIFQDSFTQIANGWSGELSANNSRVLELIAGRDTIAIPLDVELTETGNEPETIARGNMLLLNEVINPASIDPGNLAQLLTEALGDARYLRTTNNLFDVTNAATARSNIGAAADADLTAHTGNTSNPHSVTAAQVGLGNVDNTSDADKPVSTAQQTALDLKADATALTTETNARIDADNRREFAGGVYLDGVAGVLSQSLSFSCPSFAIFTKVSLADWQSGNFRSLLAQWETFSNQRSFSLGINASNKIAFSVSSDGSSSNLLNWTADTANSYSDNKTVSIFVIFNAGVIAVYVNGSQVAGSQSTTGTVESNFLSPNNIFLGATNSNLTNITKMFQSETAIFNTALTATQAAELYQQGLQPWLAANPEYRRGQEVYKSDFSLGTDGGAVSNVIATGNNNSISDGTTSHNDVLKIVADTSNSQKNFEFSIDTKVKANEPEIYNFRFKYYIPSGSNITSIRWFIGNIGLISFFGSSSDFNQIGSWVTVNTSGTITSVVSPNNRLRIYLNSASVFTGDGVNDIVYIKDVEMDQVGSLATLPLDDDCRQLKDISGNRNDATASESGVTHLKQKDLHAFRDDNADGTGGSYLIANADIIAENEVITGVTVDGRFYAASGAQDLTKRRIKLQDHGSHVDVKRSNGTTDDSAIAVTNPSDGTDFAISVLTQRI